MTEIENQYTQLAKEIRKLSLQIVHNANSSHIGGAFSMADILAVLYTDVLNISPSTVDSDIRDRFILSKGHCCASLYAVLALKGYFSKQELLNDYGKDGTAYFTHASHYLPGVETSSGSLGHGLPVSCGIALGAQKLKLPFRVYCLLGDGEMDEGSNWESILFAAQNKLDNLCIIIDYNKIQSLGHTNEIINLEPFVDKFKAFNWNVINIDGHSYSQIRKAFESAEKRKKAPTAIIANTIKGKSVSFMEGDLKWHYKSPNKEQLEQALIELR